MEGLKKAKKLFDKNPDFLDESIGKLGPGVKENGIPVYVC